MCLLPCHRISSHNVETHDKVAHDFSSPRLFITTTFHHNDFSSPRLFITTTFHHHDFSSPRLFVTTTFCHNGILVDILVNFGPLSQKTAKRRQSHISRTAGPMNMISPLFWVEWPLLIVIFFKTMHVRRFPARKRLKPPKTPKSMHVYFDIETFSRIDFSWKLRLEVKNGVVRSKFPVDMLK